MRVIHVAPTAFGSEGLLGGGERYPRQLARALARTNGVDCELVTFGPAARTLRDGPLAIRVLRPVTHLRGHPAQPLPRDLAGLLDGADLVHTHQCRALPSVVAAYLGRRRGLPVVTTDHGLGSGRLGRALPRLYDRLLAVSRSSAGTLPFPDERTSIVYGGADTDRFRPGDGAGDGVLFVGRITPHKGLDVLLRALPEGAALRVAGSGGHDPRGPGRHYPETLARLARGKQVEMVGAVDDDDLAVLYRSAAVLALPSVHRTCYGDPVAISELLGLVALEAMASGIPVVASRIGGLPEIVRHGETGYLVEPGDADELRHALGHLLGDTRTRCRMGEAARSWVVEHFTWDACARRCLAAYDAALT